MADELVVNGGAELGDLSGWEVLDPDGVMRTIVMGSYGIGIGRAMATIAETFHDDKGLVWPVTVAPFEAVVTVVSTKDDAAVAAGEALYEELKVGGVDALLDDRDARAGVKFADAELVGIPWRITVGKALADGEVELTERAGGDTRKVAVGEVAAEVAAAIEAARS